MKLCIIGCGWIAHSCHGPAYLHYNHENPHAQLDLSACCDVDIQRAEQFRAAFGFQRAYSDYRQMIETERPAAVCLLVPPPFTADLACDLLARQIPLLLEKPPGLTEAEAQRIHTAALQSGTPHMVAFNRRFTPLVQALRREFSQHFQPADLQYLRYDFTRITRADPDFSTTAIHGIDTASYLAGSPYQRIAFTYQPFPQLGPTVANVYLDCTFQSGAAARLEFCPVTGLLSERATLHLQDHTFLLDLPLSGGFDSPGRLLHLERGAPLLSLTGSQLSGSSEGWLLNGFYGENAAFFDALHQGTVPPAGIETTLQSVAIMQALRERKPVWESSAPIVEKG